MTALKRLLTATLVTLAWLVTAPTLFALGATVAWLTLTGWGVTRFVVGWAFLAVAAHLVVRHARRAKWAGLRWSLRRQVVAA